MKILASKGFTVLEMIVVIAIIVALIAVTIPGFYQFKQSLSLSRVAYKFEQDLRRMQGISLTSPSFKDAGGGPHPVDGYGIYVDTSANANKKYIIYADHNGDPLGSKHYDGGVLDYIVSTEDFSISEPGVVIKEIDNITPSGNVSINFNPPGPTTTITPTALGNRVDVVFALESDLTKTKTVSINTAGLIEVK